MARRDIFNGSDRYLLDRELSDAFRIARMLGKPLLVEGEPGTGKTALAEEYSKALGLELHVFACGAESTVEQLATRFDDVQRLTDSQALILNAQMEAAERPERIDLNGRRVDCLDDYVIEGPLAKAYQDPDSVLLIDEIDKAPRDFPNGLLYALSSRRLIIPETGRVIETTQENMPAVVITSNREQALPAPFLRRCAYHYIPFPEAETMKKIVKLHYDGAKDAFIDAAVGVFYQLRELGLERNPATGEMLDWVECLTRNYNDTFRDRRALDDLPGHSVLIKAEADLETLRHIKRHGVTETSRQRSYRK
jgi:MoxR-like ATPase